MFSLVFYAPQTSIVSTLLFNLFLNSRCTQFVGLDEGSVYILGWQGSTVCGPTAIISGMRAIFRVIIPTPHIHASVHYT